MDTLTLAKPCGMHLKAEFVFVCCNLHLRLQPLGRGLKIALYSISQYVFKAILTVNMMCIYLNMALGNPSGLHPLGGF